MDGLLTLEGREARLGTLTETQAVWLALCCAERLASGDGRSVLRAALDAAWEALRTGQGEVAAGLAARLAGRRDADDDPVATVVYALQAVLGSAEAARWALDRSLHAAFEAVPYPSGSTLFRPLDADTASDVVQRELRWQLLAADFVARAAGPAEVTTWARRQPPSG